MWKPIDKEKVKNEIETYYRTNIYPISIWASNYNGKNLLTIPFIDFCSKVDKDRIANKSASEIPRFYDIDKKVFDFSVLDESPISINKYIEPSTEIQSISKSLLKCQRNKDCLVNDRVILENVDVFETANNINRWIVSKIRYDGVHADASRNWHLGFFLNKDKDFYDPTLANFKYFDANETFRLRRGICGEKSLLMVSMLRYLGIPAQLYREATNWVDTKPNTHIMVIVQDVNRKSDSGGTVFYRFDPSFAIPACGFNEDKPLKINESTKKKGVPKLGVISVSDFVNHTIENRKIIGEIAACEWLCGNDKNDNLNECKFFSKVDERDETVEEFYTKFPEIKARLDSCNDYIQNRKPNYDFEPGHEPPQLSAEEALDLEYARSCNRTLPFYTRLGQLRVKQKKGLCQTSSDFERAWTYWLWIDQYNQRNAIGDKLKSVNLIPKSDFNEIIKYSKENLFDERFVPSAIQVWAGKGTPQIALL